MPLVGVFTHITREASAYLLVLRRWAMRRPRNVRASKSTDSHAFLYPLESGEVYRVLIANLMNTIIDSLLAGNNYPPQGRVTFDSSDHIRYCDGIDVSGHNYGCNRRIVIEKNIEGGEGYTITMINLDGVHPFWRNNIQMAPKQMRIIDASDGVVKLRGFGIDRLGCSFADYGIVLLIVDGEISRVQLDMYDRDISIVYFE